MQILKMVTGVVLAFLIMSVFAALPSILRMAANQ